MIKISKFKNNFSGQTASKMKGFSLVELMIAMFIFVIIITATVSTFTGVFSARKNARGIQKNTEEARTVMETMSKSIRMSQNAHLADTKTIVMFSQGSCVTYSFTDDNITRSSTYEPTDESDDSTYPTCDVNTSTLTDMSSTPIDGGFSVSETDSDGATPTIGRVTIMMKIGSGTSAQTLQTTVATRDYQKFFY